MSIQQSTCLISLHIKEREKEQFIRYLKANNIPIGNISAKGDKRIGIFKPYITSEEEVVHTQVHAHVSNLVKAKCTDYAQDIKIGWLNIPLLKSEMQEGVDELALVKMNSLTGVDEIQVCTKYLDIYKDQEIHHHNTLEHAYVTKVYETFPAWKEDISSIRLFKDLPKNAKEFIRALESMLGKKITYISLGNNKSFVIVR